MQDPYVSKARQELTFHVKMKRSRTLWSVPSTSSACLLSVRNLSQRISLIREVRQCRNKGKESNKINNSSHEASKTFSSFSRTIDNILSHTL